MHKGLTIGPNGLLGGLEELTVKVVQLIGRPGVETDDVDSGSGWSLAAPQAASRRGCFTMAALASQAAAARRRRSAIFGCRRAERLSHGNQVLLQIETIRSLRDLHYQAAS